MIPLGICSDREPYLRLKILETIGYLSHASDEIAFLASMEQGMSAGDLSDIEAAWEIALDALSDAASSLETLREEMLIHSRLSSSIMDAIGRNES